MLKIFGFVLSLFLLSGVVRAEDVPTLDQVYKAAESGRMDDAQRMMDTVLKEHPNSAKAHFVEAELLAKQGRMDMAEGELGNAERLKPGLPFASPKAVQELKARIQANRHVVAPEAQASGGGFPWGMLMIGIGAVAVLFFVMRAFASRQQAQNGYLPAGGLPVQGAAYGQPAYNQPYGAPPYGAPPAAGGGLGSGIMGGLATGAAVGAGMVAGEALAHHFMDGGHAAPAADAWGASGNLAQDNMGGTDFGIADNATWDDSTNIASSSDSDWG